MQNIVLREFLADYWMEGLFRQESTPDPAPPYLRMAIRPKGVRTLLGWDVYASRLACRTKRNCVMAPKTERA